MSVRAKWWLGRICRLTEADSICVPRRNRSPKRQDRRQGAALVELAIVLPVMLLIAMMTIDFGSTVSTYLVLTNAARAGADYGSTHHFNDDSRSAWEGRINTAVQAEMVNSRAYDSSKLQTTITTSVNADGTIQVAVDVRYTTSMIVQWPGFSSTVPLHYRMEMRQYQ